MFQRLNAAINGLLALLRPLLMVPLRILAWLAGRLLGQVSWRPPAWSQSLGRLCAPCLGWVRGNAGVLALILAVGAGLWWAHPMLLRLVHGVIPDRAEAQEIQVTVRPPARTEIEREGAAPHPIVLNFSAPAAPLAGIGKEAMDVTLTPSHPGKWLWTDARQLEFIPKEDWPVGGMFKVRLGKKALAPHVSLEEREFEVPSPAFELTATGAEFYQDPVQANLRKAVFTFRFSHPVQPESLEKRLTLSYRNQATALLYVTGSNVKYTITYDRLRLNATVQSEPLAIPAESATMVLRIVPGVAAQRGGKPQDKELLQSVEVPGLNSLAIQAVDSSVVTGDDGDPEHVLRLQTNMPVHEREMAAMVVAWALPSRDGEGWGDPSQVTDAVLQKAAKVALTPIPQEREAGDTHNFRFTADPGAYLFVRVQKGLKGVGGYQLGAAREALLRVPAFAPELSIMSKGSLLALNGDKKLPILVRDLPGLHVELARLQPHQLHLLATQSDGSYTRPEFYRSIGPNDLSEFFKRDIPLKLRPGKTHYETVDFAEYLKGTNGERRGVFLLRARGYDPAKGGAGNDVSWDNEERHYYYDSHERDGQDFNPASMQDIRLVVVTDLGFLVKRGADGSRDVFVQSIHEGTPVADAQVEVWGRNGLVLVSRKTDGDGHAQLPNLNAYVREKQPVVVVVKKADDVAFLPLNGGDRALDLSRFDVGGAYSAGLPNQMRAFLFSDRGIYRPGDTMHIGVVVKSGDWSQSATGLPVEAEIIDARGLVVKRDKLQVGASGMAEVAFETTPASPTGNYTVNLNLPREAAEHGAPLRLGTVTVKVQEFMPDRMKVKAELSASSEEGWVSPEGLKALINVQNLFGTPAQKRRVEATVTLTPAYPAFRAYPDYAFYDPQRAQERYSDPLASAETDAQGNVELDLGLQRYAAATYRLNLLVKVFEPEGGRNVAAETSALVSERPYLVGFKADGGLGYISRNATRQVSLIAIDPRARKTAVSGLTLQRVERRVVSVLVKQYNGLYKYESRAKEVVLKEQPLNLPAEGSRINLASDTPGNFAYVIRDNNGLELNRITYSVAGTGNVTRSLDRNAELQLTLNRQDYEPGDEVEISVRAPYTGAGLITVERDRVYAYKWFKADRTATVQKIRLPKNFEGNGYVMVQYVRDPASDEVYMSPLSYGVVPFATSLKARTTPITLNAPELVKPGQTVKMRLDAPKDTRAVVFAVDEGILQVARYKTPDPLKFFFEKRALEVQTFQILDLILPEFRKLMQAAAPGGDAESPLGKHLNPFKRKTDKPVVYWSGVVDVGGGREFSYTVPENFNGSLRVMAVAVNASSVAAAATRTQVRGDLILLPTVPVALTPGDEVEIGVGLANNVKGSGKDAPVSLSLKTSPHLEVVGPANQTLKVSERGEASTKFRIRARSGAQTKLGSASVVFTARHGNASARLSTDLSVRPASPFVTLVQTGRFQGSGEIKTQGNMYPDLQRSELAISAAPWSYTAGLMRYLSAYPHGCTEQITSQTFPWVVLSTQPALAGNLLEDKPADAGATSASARNALQRTVGILRGRQTAEGGFGLWDAGYVEPFASTYATHMLVEAKERKLPVPDDMLRRANSYLQSFLATQPGGYRATYNWRNQAYAAYLLTRQGVVTSAALVNLRGAMPMDEGRKPRPDLGLVYLAASYRMLKQEQAARELLEPVWQDLLQRIRTNRARDYWDYYYDPLVHEAMTIHLIAKHFPERMQELPPEAFERIGEMIRKGWYHSLSSASVVLAVDAYATAAAQSAVAGGLQATATDRQGRSRKLVLPTPTPLAKVAVDAGTASLHLTNRGDFPLYYALSEAGYERELPNAAQASGLEVVREFLDASGKPIQEAKLGDEVTVRIRVRSTGRDAVDNVAVADLLPGGLEPVLTSPDDSENGDEPLWRRRLGGRGSWSVQYADIREDRVLFYGQVQRQDGEVTYKARATNVGDFVVPGLWAEAMYDRRTFARSAAGRFKVKGLAP